MNNWIAIHIWYHDITQQDDLLLDCVTGIATSLVELGFVQRYFFIRFFEGGPHVRLRLLPHEGRERECKAYVEAAVEEYLLGHPSSPPAGAWKWGYLGVEQESDNSWRWMPYDPEIERYGGSEGIQLAEEHFHLSSEIALDVIERSYRSRDPVGAKVSYALQLGSVVPLAAGFTGQLTQRFYEDTLKNVYVDETRDKDYPDVFRRLRDYFVPRFQQLEVLEVDWALGGDDTVLRWGAANRKIFDRLSDVLKAGPEHWAKPKPGATTGRGKYGQIVQSYLHMFYNRLGFWGAQEERLLRLSRDLWQSVTLAP